MTTKKRIEKELAYVREFIELAEKHRCSKDIRDQFFWTAQIRAHRRLERFLVDLLLSLKEGD